jgi:DNA invertase Pin-like site-specific DNA recombinase
MKHVALYIRVSTEDKQTKGMLSQEDALIEYCKNHQITNYKIYTDKITGGTLDRTGLCKLQEDIFRGRVSTVICWKLDRLSRNLRQGINLLTEWMEKDIRILCVCNGFDFSGSVGKLILSVLLAIAEIEKNNISENIRRGIQLSRKNKNIQIGGSKPKFKPEDVLALKRAGKNITQIAKQLQCSRQTIYTTIARVNPVKMNYC